MSWRVRNFNLRRIRGNLPLTLTAARNVSASVSILPASSDRRSISKDLVDVPEEAKQSLKFVPVENVDEVLAAALEKDGTAKPASADEAGEKGKD